MPRESFGEAIGRHLDASGMTQEALADAIGVNTQVVSDWVRMRARTKIVEHLDQLAAMSEAFGLPSDQLLRDAGYVECETTTEQAIRADRRLSKGWRTSLLTMLRAALSEGNGSG